MSNVNTSAIRWPQVLNLALLDLAILISWIAYHEFQPKLLEQFKFTEFALALAVLQMVVLVATPPIAGHYADKMMRKGGNRLPVVTVGINFVSMVFMIVALTVLVNPGGWIRFLFPVMVALWLVAMNIFHSPAISLLESFVPARQLPKVVAVFAILAGMMAAVEPVVVDLITFFGGPLTFAVGGVLVFTTGVLFVRSTKGIGMGGHEGSDAGEQRPTHSNFILVLCLGLLIGAATTFFFKLAPVWMDKQLVGIMPAGWKGAWLASILIAASAVLAFPFGIIAARIGARNMALGAGVACALLIAGIAVSSGTLAMALYCIYPVAFAAASVSFLPLAFGALAKGQTVLGIGLFFSGIELIAGLVDIYQVANP